MQKSDNKNLREYLSDKTIDSHSHIGMNLKAYSCMEYPYGQTAEEIYFKQTSFGIDANIVFPAGSGLHFDPAYFAAGEMIPAMNPVSPFPYAIENEMMMLEIFKFNPNISNRFIPFVASDPARAIDSQIDLFKRLEQSYKISGIKISPVECQSKIIELLDTGRPILEFAEERDLPFILHTTVDPNEVYSNAKETLKVVKANPNIRFCLAHCIGFHKRYLDEADELPNTWIDTAAFKIQVQCTNENMVIMADEKDRFKADYSNYYTVIKALTDEYPDSMIWGTDSPYYTFFCRRKQGESNYIDFHLKAGYEDEINALRSLSRETQKKISNTNTLDFLFGAANKE